MERTHSSVAAAVFQLATCTTTSWPGTSSSVTESSSLRICARAEERAAETAGGARDRLGVHGAAERLVTLRTGERLLAHEREVDPPIDRRLPAVRFDAPVEEREPVVRVLPVLREVRERQEGVGQVVARHGVEQLVEDECQRLPLARRLRRSQQAAERVEVGAVLRVAHAACGRDVEVTYRDDHVL